MYWGECPFTRYLQRLVTYRLPAQVSGITESDCKDNGHHGPGKIKIVHHDPTGPKGPGPAHPHPHTCSDDLADIHAKLDIALANNVKMQNDITNYRHKIVDYEHKISQYEQQMQHSASPGKTVHHTLPKIHERAIYADIDLDHEHHNQHHEGHPHSPASDHPVEHHAHHEENALHADVRHADKDLEAAKHRVGADKGVKHVKEEVKTGHKVEKDVHKDTHEVHEKVADTHHREKNVLEDGDHTHHYGGSSPSNNAGGKHEEALVKLDAEIKLGDGINAKKLKAAELEKEAGAGNVAKDAGIVKAEQGLAKDLHGSGKTVGSDLKGIEHDGEVQSTKQSAGKDAKLVHDDLKSVDKTLIDGTPKKDIHQAGTHIANTYEDVDDGLFGHDYRAASKELPHDHNEIEAHNTNDKKKDESVVVAY